MGHSEIAQVMAHDARRYEALRSGDVECLASLLSDDFLYVHSTGRIDTRHDLLERLRSGGMRYLRIDRQPISAALLGADLCRIFERVRLRVETARGVSEHDSLVISHWSRTADWQARTIQSTAAPAEHG